MVRAEPSFDRDGRDVWYGQFNPGRFWHTIRGEDGKAVNFATEHEAMEAARVEWWDRVKPPVTRAKDRRQNRKRWRKVKLASRTRRSANSITPMHGGANAIAI